MRYQAQQEILYCNILIGKRLLKKERKKGIEKRRSTSAVGASQRSNYEQGKLITAVVNAQRNTEAVSSVVYPKNGSSRNRNTTSILRTTAPCQVSIANSSESSALTFVQL